MQAKGFGFTHVKIKVDADDPARLVNRVRNYIGDDIELRVDANCAWDRSNAEVFMKELANLGVVSVEQPLQADDIEGCARLRSLGIMNITLDESVHSITSIRKIAERKACDIVNVRVSKCGGIVGSMNVIKSAKKYGIDIQLGAHVGETCILSAAGAHLASGTRSFRWLEGAYGKYLLKNSLCTDEIQFSRGGLLNPPDGFGLGIKLDRELVNEATVGSISI
jgi:muconate cycloisomerase